MELEFIGLSKRAYFGLKRADINTTEELISYDEFQIRKIHGIGDKSMKEIKYRLSALGLGLSIENDDGYK